MGAKTSISWTGSTWSPTGGCTKTSPACTHCFAETLSHRFGWTSLPWTTANEAANVTTYPKRLEVPLRWSEPHLIFVDSTADLFHRRVSNDFIAAVFAIMARTPRHTYQVLTKRPERMRDLLSSAGFWAQVETLAFAGLPARTGEAEREELARVNIFAGFAHLLVNVALGTSIENNRFAYRADLLRDTPAARRFISAEPLLGSIGALDLAWIDQLIVGGESGPGARAMQPTWVEEARDRADAAGTAFFFKQLGVVLAHQSGLTGKGVTPAEWPADWTRHEQPSRLSYSQIRTRENLRTEISGRAVDERLTQFRAIGTISDELITGAARL
jgi:protein gp37